MSNPAYYQPSGKFSPLSIILLLLMAITIFPLLALAYTYASWYIPFVYINFILTIAFGFAVGYMVNTFVIKQGKVRNVWLGALLAAIGGLIAMYFNYVIWLNLLFHLEADPMGPEPDSLITQILNFAVNPVAVFSLMKEINAIGTWGIKSSSAVSGTFLTIIWLIEAAVVIGLPAFMSISRTSLPFCESSNSWAEEIAIGGFNSIENKDEFIANLEIGDLSQLTGLGKTEEEESSSLHFFKMEESATCYVSVNNHQIDYDEDGKPDLKLDNVIEYVKIPIETANTILRSNGIAV